jgi:methyltransferase
VLRTAIGAALVIAFLLVEARRSRANERGLRSRGAIEPSGDVIRVMRIAYPAVLLAPFAEAALTGPATTPVWTAGLAFFAAAKSLKFAAIRALGPRWTFRVLVVPGDPLVTSGPYRYLRHPNYVAVAGEIAGAAAMCAAPVTGVAGMVAFGALMLRRIAVEERALSSPSSR